MDSLNKSQYLKILKVQLNKMNFIHEDKFDSIIESLKDIDVIGFDIDFTLLQYNIKNMIKLMYESICKYLINHKKYPKKIKYQYHKDFIQSFSKKGFVIDYKNGNCLKLGKDKSIIKCYHGKKELIPNEINNIYEENKYHLFHKSNTLINEHFYMIIDNFHSQNLALFMICVDLFDEGELKIINNYKDIIIHIIEAMNYSFYIKAFEDFSNFGYIFPEIFKNPEIYLDNNNSKKLLIKLKEKGKNLFFATNSNYSYSNFILEKTIGKNYDKYFDLCFFKSSKPGFFTEPKEAESKCFFLEESELSCKELNDEIYNKIKNGNKKLSGGSYFLVQKFFEKMLNKTNIKYLFVGDNILSDCQAASKFPGWNSILIYDNIKLQFVDENSFENKKDNYSNILCPYFEDEDCKLALPNINGLDYIIV